MKRIEDVNFSVVFNKQKLTKTGVSGLITRDAGQDVLVTIVRGSGTTATKLYFYHCNSTETAAAATAFTTLPSLSVAAASGSYAVLFEGQNAMKKNIRIKLSAIAASQAICVIAHQFTNRAIPSTSTLGSYTSLTRPLV